MSLTGLYIHVPFCIKICPYCAFYKMPWHRQKETCFVENLEKEIALYNNQYGKIPIDTIFFGGGTPNVIRKKSFDRIMKLIHTNFDVDTNSEVTMEMNPGVHSISKLKFFKGMGVNRVSVGVQSFDEAILKDYGRNHAVKDVDIFIEQVLNVGFSNINIDVIFGHPKHSKQKLTDTLNKASQLNLPHLALYGLTISKGTAFYDSGLSIDNDQQAEQYSLIQTILQQHQYNQYEVSNFSKKGFESKHNIKYWTSQSTLGLGPGAHSYFLGNRYSNAANYANYIKSCQKNLPSNTVIKQDWNEFIGARLRFRKPILFDDIKNQHGVDIKKILKNQFLHLNKAGFLDVNSKQFCITKKGFVVLDEILSHLILSK